jgi:hypothetical protein
LILIHKSNLPNVNDGMGFGPVYEKELSQDRNPDSVRLIFPAKAYLPGLLWSLEKLLWQEIFTQIQKIVECCRDVPRKIVGDLTDCTNTLRTQYVFLQFLDKITLFFKDFTDDVPSHYQHPILVIRLDLNDAKSTKYGFWEFTERICQCNIVDTGRIYGYLEKRVLKFLRI